MKIYPLYIDIDNKSPFMNDKEAWIEIAIFRIEYGYGHSADLFRFFYNAGSIFVTLFFKDVFTRIGDKVRRRDV